MTWYACTLQPERVRDGMKGAVKGVNALCQAIAHGDDDMEYKYSPLAVSPDGVVYARMVGTKLDFIVCNQGTFWLPKSQARILTNELIDVLTKSFSAPFMHKQDSDVCVTARDNADRTVYADTCAFYDAVREVTGRSPRRLRLHPRRERGTWLDRVDAFVTRRSDQLVVLVIVLLAVLIGLLREL